LALRLHRELFCAHRPLNLVRDPARRQPAPSLALPRQSRQCRGIPRSKRGDLAFLARDHYGAARNDLSPTPRGGGRRDIAEQLEIDPGTLAISPGTSADIPGIPARMNLCCLPDDSTNADEGSLSSENPPQVERRSPGGTLGVPDRADSGVTPRPSSLCCNKYVRRGDLPGFSA